MSNKNLDKNTVINKLIKKGLKPKYYKGTHTISHFEQPQNVFLGNKSWGYIDFLNIPIVKIKKK